MSAPATKPEFALMAEFRSSRELLHAIERSRAAGYTELRGLHPLPDRRGLGGAWRTTSRSCPCSFSFGGIVGALTGYFLQFWVSVINYPVNVGGRPLHS